MNLAEFGRLLLRRWYIVLLGLVATAGMAFAASQAVPPAYTATSSVLIYRPVAMIGQEGNPFVALGGLEAARDIVLKAVNDPTALKELTSEPGQEIEVVADAQSSAPLVSISTTAPSPQRALAMQAFALKTVTASLDRIQVELGVPATTRVDSLVLAKSTEAETSRKSQLRAVLVAVALGLGLTVVLTLLFDRWRRRARAKRLMAAAVTPDAAPDVEAQHPEPAGAGQR